MDIEGIANVSIALAKQGEDVSIIVDPDVTAQLIEFLKQENNDLFVYSECQDSMEQDLREARKENVPFMVSVVNNKEIITERVHTEWKTSAFSREPVYLVQDKYQSIKHKIRPKNSIVF